VIAQLRGKPVGSTPEGLVLDVGGVGYLVAATPSALRKADGAEEVVVETYLHVREDAMQLYGFAAEEERELFELLVSVQGVGPKVALGVLGAGPPREIVSAIAVADVRRLQSAPGIGKRIAERIVAELREKVGISSSDADGAPIVISRSDGPHELARAGLLELGYEPGEADGLLRSAAGDTAEELLASALKAARG
jgi:Holliday junction DNA helicase RuvA